MHPGGRDDIQVIRDELEVLRTELDAVRSAGEHPWTSRFARPRLAKRLTRVGLVALMLALPVMVSASHQFTDVPTSHTFHAAIAKLYGARLTAGCTATKFCPNANVTRGQMAAFLNRGLGRAAGDAGTIQDDWGVFETGALTSVNLLHGGAPGGTAHVLVTASVSAYTDENGICPCEMLVYLLNEDTGEESPLMFDIIGSEPGPVNGTNPRYYEASTSISYLFTVPSGVTHTYVLGAAMNATLTPSPENDAAVAFSISAVYLPFGATGGNPSLVTTQGSKSPRAR